MPAEPQAGSETWALALEYIAARRRAEEALGFIAACGAELAATLDEREVARRVADLAVPFLADECSVDLTTSDGSLESDADAAPPAAGPVQTREGRLLVTPVGARGLTFGRIVLVREAGRAPFGDPEVALAQEVARRVAAAVELARLHARLGAAR